MPQRRTAQGSDSIDILDLGLGLGTGLVTTSVHEHFKFTGSSRLTPHGKWREIDLQLPCWLQLTLLG